MVKAQPGKPAFRRRRPRCPEPETAASVLSEVVARLGGADRMVEQRVFAAWATAVGAVVERRARPEAVRGKTLFVRVESSAFAHQLTLLRQQVLARIATVVGEDVVTEIRTRVG